jgi:CheY-like chemotaxis protein
MGVMLSLGTAGAPQRILVVDDDVAIHRVLERILAVGLGSASPEPPSPAEHGSLASAPAKPYALAFASSGQEAVTLAERARGQRTPFGVALVDMRMPGWDGIETVTRLLRVEPQLQVAICSAYMDYSWQETLDRLQRPGLRQLRKPWSSGQVLATVQELCQRAQSGTGTFSAHPQSRAPAKPTPGR